MPGKSLTQATVFSSALLTALCLAGCAQQAGSVTGKVTYQGKPVVIGSVVLVNEETLAPIQETIGPDGTYHIGNVPYGMYIITVHSVDPRRRSAVSRPIPDNLAKKPKETKPPPARPDADKWFAIPERYSDWRQSRLSVGISQSSTNFDIPLAD